MELMELRGTKEGRGRGAWRGGGGVAGFAGLPAGHRFAAAMGVRVLRAAFGDGYCICVSTQGGVVLESATLYSIELALF